MASNSGTNEEKRAKPASWSALNGSRWQRGLMGASNPAAALDQDIAVKKEYLCIWNATMIARSTAI